MAGGDEIIRFGVEIGSQVWRVSDRRFTPMVPPPREKQGMGRFDDVAIGVTEGIDGFAVLYGAENPQAAFIEVLEQHRPRLDHLRRLTGPLMLDAGERESILSGFGSVPSGWMERTQLTNARIVTRAPLLDLASAGAVQIIRERLALTILAMGEDDLDFSHVLSDNRDLTRAISRWLWMMTNAAGEPLFAGIRYRSRFDPECICIALYQDRFRVEGDIVIQAITPDTPGFAEAASTLRLTIS